MSLNENLLSTPSAEIDVELSEQQDELRKAEAELNSSIENVTKLAKENDLLDAIAGGFTPTNLEDDYPELKSAIDSQREKSEAVSALRNSISELTDIRLVQDYALDGSASLYVVSDNQKVSDGGVDVKAAA